MTDPITPLTPVVPLAGPRASFAPAPTRAPAATPAEALPEPESSFAPTSPTPPAPAPAQSPVALSVDRDASGVFVYTLTDRGTGQVLAVIPRALTKGATGPTAGAGAGIDIQA